MLNSEQQIFEQINKSNNILITFSNEWNADALGSGIALYLYIKKLEKTVHLVSEGNNKNKKYSFLPKLDEIKDSLNNLRNFIISLDLGSAKVGEIKYETKEDRLDFVISPKEGFFTADDVKSQSSNFKYDLIITLDTPDLDSLGKIYEEDTDFFYQVPIINIDHNSQNEQFGQINYVELPAISTSEILFNLFEKYNSKLIDEDIATCLLSGIIAKTRNFKTGNITPRSLSIASQLIELGADREKIVKSLYRSLSINILKLWGRTLARLSSSSNKKLVWSLLTENDFNKTETKEGDLEDVIDELIVNIPQAEVIVLLHESREKENKTQLTKCVIKTTKNINALDLGKSYNASGTRNLATFNVSKQITEAEQDIIGNITEKMKKISY